MSDRPDRRERIADAGVHAAGLAAAPVAALWLLTAAWPRCGAAGHAALLTYALAMTGMLAASAAYHLTPWHRDGMGARRDLVRRLDHAMIFAAIAGTYTPLLQMRLEPQLAGLLCAGMWAAAGIGMLLKLLVPHRCERFGVALYLALGWVGIVAIVPLWTALTPLALALILGGCLVYSAGAAAYVRPAFRFQTALWHAAVLGAAALQFAAMMVEFAPSA